MSRLIITFESLGVHQPQPWPIGIDENNIVTSGLGRDDGATLIGFGVQRNYHVDVYASEIREHPEKAVGLVPTFATASGMFEWSIRIKEVSVHA